MQKRVGCPLIAEKAALFQLVKHTPDVIQRGLDLFVVGYAAGRLAFSSTQSLPAQPGHQLAFQLGTRVVAQRQQPQCGRLERGGGYSPPPASVSTGGMPTDSRTLFSISRASSAFSRRNSRALSLPWPIFSPL